jgi:hypothetical protein
MWKAVGEGPGSGGGQLRSSHLSTGLQERAHPGQLPLDVRQPGQDVLLAAGAALDLLYCPVFEEQTREGLESLSQATVCWD